MRLEEGARRVLTVALEVALHPDTKERIQQQDRQAGAGEQGPGLESGARRHHEQAHQPGEHENGRDPIPDPAGNPPG